MLDEALAPCIPSLSTLEQADRKAKTFGDWSYSKSMFNSLWPSDTIWRHKSGSTLAQVMACCLMAPSHYLNQC